MAKTDDLADLLQRNLLEVFSERDASKRLMTIKQLYAENGVFYEGENEFVGWEAINQKVTSLLASFPSDLSFYPIGTPARNHSLGRLRWRLGAKTGSITATGMDIARFQDDRIQELYVFVDVPTS